MFDINEKLTSITLARGSVAGYFWPIAVYYYCFYVSPFPESYSVSPHQFLYRCCWYYCDGCLTIFKKKFTACLLLLEAILGYFGAHFGLCSFWKLVNLFSWNFVNLFLVFITLMVSTLRELFCKLFSSAGGHFGGILGLILGYVSLFLEN